MTSKRLENVQVDLVSEAVTRYKMIYFGNSSKIGICSKINQYIKKSDVENLTKLFLFHRLL